MERKTHDAMKMILLAIVSCLAIGCTKKEQKKEWETDYVYVKKYPKLTYYKMKDNRKHAYLNDGTLVGRFDFCSYWYIPGEQDYFVGYSYTNSVFYFAEPDTIVRTKEPWVATTAGLLIKTDQGVEFRDYFGKLMLIVPDSVYAVSRFEGRGTARMIGFSHKGDSVVRTIYDIYGKAVREISPEAWNKIVPKIRMKEESDMKRSTLLKINVLRAMPEGNDIKEGKKRRSAAIKEVLLEDEILY